MKTFERHPISAMFRDLNEAQKKIMHESIKENGQQEPGLIFEDMVLDGWQRYTETTALGLNFHYKTFEGTYAEAVQKVICLNLERRHMNDEDRRITGAKLLKLMKQKKNGHNHLTPKEELNGTHKENKSQYIVSKALNISSGSLSRAAYVNTHHPEVFKECENGSLGTHKAYLKCKRIEDGILQDDGEITFPDAYSQFLEVEAFLKKITKKGWACNITAIDGTFEAKFVRCWSKGNLGNHKFSGAVVTALLPVRKTIELELLKPI